MKTPYMDRNTTAAIKGIALILMFVHHFFTFPHWYVDGISYPAIAPFVKFLQGPTQICVTIFAFLTGYLYYFVERKTYRYSLRKITDLLLSYWTVYIPLLILAVALGCYRFSVPAVAAELFALNRPIMLFCWYVHFYCAAMLVLPVLVKISSDTLAGDIFLLLIFPVLAFTTLQGVLEYELRVDSGAILEVLSYLKKWLPCIVCGYLCAKYALFDGYLDTLSARVTAGWQRTLFWLLLCGGAFFGRLLCPELNLGSIRVAENWIQLTFSMDILYAPLFLYGAINILQRVNAAVIRRPLEAIGKQSMLMWFLHCAFFNDCAVYTQPVLYFLKNPLLVLLFGLGICYLAAIVIDYPLKRILQLKNKGYFAAKKQRSL